MKISKSKFSELYEQLRQNSQLNLFASYECLN